MTALQLHVLNGALLIALVVIAYLTQVTVRQVVALLFVGFVLGAAGLALVALGNQWSWWHAPISWEARFVVPLVIHFTLVGATLYIVALDLARRFGWRGPAGLAVVLVFAALALDYARAVGRAKFSEHANKEYDGREQATIVIGNRRLMFTHGDAQKLKAVLLARLADSTVEDREYLLTRTRDAPAWIDVDGHLRIGPWLLESRRESVVLTHRMPHSASGGGVYVAYLEPHESASRWTVKKFEFERVKYLP